MISRKKKVTKKVLKRTSNPLSNSDIKTWRVIGYLNLIDGYSDKFKTAVADGLDTAGIVWGQYTVVITMKDFLSILKESNFIGSLRNEYHQLLNELSTISNPPYIAL